MDTISLDGGGVHLTSGWHSVLDDTGKPTLVGVPIVSKYKRWIDKANAYAKGWNDGFTTVPTYNCVVLGLSVAQHETWCGDAWKGEFNWGAVQKRSLTANERQFLANKGIKCAYNNVGVARQAFADGIKDGSFTPPADWDHCALHTDTSPVSGIYWVFFWKFASDQEGAGFFIKILARNRPSCKAILMLESGTEYQLAAAMYATHYYEGFHDPHQPNGAQDNINDYAHALLNISPSIKRYLGNVKWTPIDPTPKFDVTSVKGAQIALNYLGASPELVEDGLLGPKTKSFIARFQADHGLPLTGAADDATVQVLQTVLASA